MISQVLSRKSGVHLIYPQYLIGQGVQSASNAEICFRRQAGKAGLSYHFVSISVLWRVRVSERSIFIFLIETEHFQTRPDNVLEKNISGWTGSTISNISNCPLLIDRARRLIL